MTTATVSLNDGDRTFLLWLAERVRSAAEVLDEINDSQLFHAPHDEVKRAVVRDALTKAILEDSSRLANDLDQLPKGSLLEHEEYRRLRRQIRETGKEGA